ncbi:uncharacterized protein LOC144631671 isoform X2 [Oculina patagonica]
MGKPGSQKRGQVLAIKGARGASMKTSSTQTEPPAKPKNQGASKISGTWRRAKPRSQGASKKTSSTQTKPPAKPRSQGASKKTTTKPQAKPRNQGSSKKTSTKKAQPQAKQSIKGASKKTTTKPQAKPRNQGSSKKTSTKKAQPQAKQSIKDVLFDVYHTVIAPAAPAVVQRIVENVRTRCNALPHEVNREEGPAPKRRRVTPPGPSTLLHRLGNELAREGYEEDSPAPKRRKAVREGTPSYDELEKLANEIPSDWKKLGRRLGIKEAKLTAIERENNYETSEQAYRMLRHWKQSKACEATYNELFEALSNKETGVSRSDLALKYCCQKR